MKINKNANSGENIRNTQKMTVLYILKNSNLDLILS